MQIAIVIENFVFEDAPVATFFFQTARFHWNMQFLQKEQHYHKLQYMLPKICGGKNIVCFYLFEI